MQQEGYGLALPYTRALPIQPTTSYSFLFCFLGYKLGVKCTNRGNTCRNYRKPTITQICGTVESQPLETEFSRFYRNNIKLSIKNILGVNRRVHIISYISYKKEENLIWSYQKRPHSSYSGVVSNAMRKCTVRVSCLCMPVTGHCQIALRRHLCLLGGTDVQATKQRATDIVIQGVHLRNCLQH